MSDEVAEVTQRGDADRGVVALLELKEGIARGIDSDDAVAALRKMGPNVGIEFTPADSLKSHVLRLEGERIVLDGYSVPDGWDRSDLGHHEAASLLDDAVSIRPTRVKSA